MAKESTAWRKVRKRERFQTNPGLRRGRDRGVPSPVKMRRLGPPDSFRKPR